MEKVEKDNVILKVSNLTKKFGNFTAVDHLGFNVERGEVFGFLGPNGAGKTTSISMICGLLKPDSGEVIINGESIRGKKSNVKRLIGLCPQNIMLWENLTCIEQLEFMGRMYDMEGKDAKKSGLELLDALGLMEKKNKLAKTLSGGMQRRLNIALALVHRPEIVILDEPQSGLDPQSRVLVREYISSLTKKITVILTTHDMDEAERLSSRVAIIDKGKMLVMDTPDNLKDKINEGDILEIQINDDYKNGINEKLFKFPKKVCNMSYNEGIISVTSTEIMEIIPDVASVLKSSGIEVQDMRIRKKTLEDVFISLTGRGLRE